MEHLLNAALSNAALVALVAPLVVAVDRWARRPALSHALWLLLLVKLVSPPFLVVPAFTSGRWGGTPPPSAPAAGSAAPAVRPAPPATGRPAAEHPAAPPPPLLPAPTIRPAPTVAPTPTAAPAPRPWWPGPDALAAGWLAIAAGWLASLLARAARAGRLLRAAPAAPESLARRVAELSGRLGLRSPPDVRLVPGPHSPLVLGLFSRPLLVIPAGLWCRLDAGQRDALIVHELAHLRRGDHRVRHLELVVVALYWWFPVAWWARRALRAAEEHCCDAWVLRTLPGAGRSYARALLDAVDFLAEAREPLPVLASGLDDAGEIRARLARIIEGRTRPSLSGAAAAALLPIAGVLLPLAPLGTRGAEAWRLERATDGEEAGQVHTRPGQGPLGTMPIQQPGQAPLEIRPAPLPEASYALAVDLEGRAIVAGLVLEPDGQTRRVAVSRFRADGRPDPAFGDRGTTRTDLVAGPFPYGFGTGDRPCVAVQPDGRIVAAATVTSSQTYLSDFGLQRLRTDGSIDRSFGRDGLVLTNVGLSLSGRTELPSMDRLAAIAVQADGRIVVAGTNAANIADGDKAALARYGPGGSLDPDFGTGGLAVFGWNGARTPGGAGGVTSPSREEARGLALAPDGRIAVVAITEGMHAVQIRDAAVFVRDAAGRPDPRFGDGGRVRLDIDRQLRDPSPGSLDEPRAVAFAPDGSLVVAVDTGADQPEPPAGPRRGGSWNLAVVRLDAQGRPDPSFGRRGTAVPGLSFPVSASRLWARPDGRLLVAGRVAGDRWPDDDIRMAPLLLRLDAAGRLDPDFGTGGSLIAPAAGDREAITDLQPLPDGVLTAGFAAVEGRGTMLILGRYSDRPAGSPPLAALAGGTLAAALAVAADRRLARSRP